MLVRMPQVGSKGFGVNLLKLPCNIMSLPDLMSYIFYRNLLVSSRFLFYYFRATN